MKKSHLIVVGAAVAVLLLLIVAYSIYNKPHIDIQRAEAVYRLTVDEMLDAFMGNEVLAREKYSGKVIELTGDFQSMAVGDQDHKYIVLEGENGLANCGMEARSTVDASTVRQGDKIVIKGFCIGYDNLLDEVQFKNCRIVSI